MSELDSFQTKKEASEILKILTNDSSNGEASLHRLVIDGSQISTEETNLVLVGKFILLDFGGRWCPYCVRFGPQVQRIWDGDDGWEKILRDKKIEALVILLSVDQSFDEFVEHLRVLPKSACGLKPGDSRVEKLISKFGIRGFPSAITIDIEGKVISSNARDLVNKNLLVTSAHDLSLLGTISGSSTLVTKDQAFLIRGSDKILGEEFERLVSNKYLLIAYGDPGEGQTPSTATLEYISRKFVDRMLVVYVPISTGSSLLLQFKQLLESIDKNPRLSADHFPTNSSVDYFIIPPDQIERIKMIGDAIPGFNKNYGKAPSGAAIFNSKFEMVVDDVLEILNRIDESTFLISSACFPFDDSVVSLHQAISTIAMTQVNSVDFPEKKYLEREFVTQKKFTFLLLADTEVPEESLIKARDLMSNLVRTSGGDTCTLVVLATFVDSDKCKIKLGAAFKEYLGDVFYASCNSNGSLSQLIFWNAAKFPTHELAEEVNAIVFNSVSGDRIYDGSITKLAGTPSRKNFPWYPVIEALRGAKVKSKQNSIILDVMDVISRCREEGQMIALLFSGKWCYWCRDFRPKLEKVYKRFEHTKAAFEVIFISRDRTEDEFEDFYAQMPWLALTWESRQLGGELMGKLGIEGIPGLVFLSPEGNILEQNGDAAIREDHYPAPHMLRKRFEMNRDRFLQKLDSDDETTSGQIIETSISGGVFGAIDRMSPHIRLWAFDKETPSGGQFITIFQAHESPVRIISFSSPSGKYFATGDKAGVVKIWFSQIFMSPGSVFGKAKAAVTGEAALVVGKDNEVANFSWVGNDSSINESSQLLVMMLDGSLITLKPNSRGEFVQCGRMSPVQDYNKMSLCLFDVPSSLIDRAQSILNEGALQDDDDAGWFMAYGSSNGDCSISVWRIPTSNQEGKIPEVPAELLQKNKIISLQGHTGDVASVVSIVTYEPQLNTPWPFLLSGSRDKTIRVWSTVTWSCSLTLSQHSAAVSEIRVPRAHQQKKGRQETPKAAMWFLSLDVAGKVLLWNTRLWCPVRELDLMAIDPEPGIVVSVAFPEHQDFVHSLVLARSNGQIYFVDLSSSFDQKSGLQLELRVEEGAEEGTKLLFFAADTNTAFTLKQSKNNEVIILGCACLRSQDFIWRYPFNLGWDGHVQIIHKSFCQVDILCKDQVNWNICAKHILLRTSSENPSKDQQHSLAAVSWSKASRRITLRTYSRTEAMKLSVEVDCVAALDLMKDSQKLKGIDQTIPIAATSHVLSVGTSSRFLLAWSVEFKSENADPKTESETMGAAYLYLEGRGVRRIHPTSCNVADLDMDCTRVFGMATVDFGRKLALFHATSDGGELRLYDVFTGNFIRRSILAQASFCFPSMGEDVAFTMSSNFNGGWLSMFHPCTNQVLFSSVMIPYIPMLKQDIIAMSWRPGGRFNSHVALAKKSSSQVEIWDLSGKGLIKTLCDTSAEQAHVTNLCFSLDGEKIVVECQDSPKLAQWSYRVFDVRTGRCLYSFSSTENSMVHSLSFVRENAVVALAYHTWGGMVFRLHDCSFLGGQPPIHVLANAVKKDLQLVESHDISQNVWTSSFDLLERYPGLVVEVCTNWRKPKPAEKKDMAVEPATKKRQTKQKGEKSSHVKKGQPEQDSFPACDMNEPDKCQASSPKRSSFIAQELYAKLKKPSSLVSKKNPEGDTTANECAGEKSEEAVEMAKHEQEKIEALFHKLDSDKSGSLDIREVSAMFANLGVGGKVDKFFREADKDKNNKLTLDEFMIAYHRATRNGQSEIVAIDEFFDAPFDLEYKTFVQYILESSLDMEVPEDIFGCFLPVVEFLFSPRGQKQNLRRKLAAFAPISLQGGITHPIGLVKYKFELFKNARPQARPLNALQGKRKSDEEEKFLTRVTVIVRFIMIAMADLAETDATCCQAFATLSNESLVWAIGLVSNDSDGLFAAEKLLRYYPLQEDQNVKLYFESRSIVSILERNGLTKFLKEIIGDNNFKVEALSLPYVRSFSETLLHAYEDQLRSIKVAHGQDHGMSMFTHKFVWFPLTPLINEIGEETKYVNSTGLMLLETLTTVADKVGRIDLLTGDFSELVIEFLWTQNTLRRYTFVLMSYLIMLVCFTGLTWYYDTWKENGAQVFGGFVYLVIVILVILFFLFELFDISHAIKLRAEKRRNHSASFQVEKFQLLQACFDYLRHPWNICDLTSNICVLVGSSLTISQSKTAAATNINSVAFVLVYFKILYFLRAFKFSGPLVYVVVYIAQKLTTFLLIIWIVLIGFTFAFNHLAQASGDTHTDDIEYSDMHLGLRSAFFALNGGLKVKSFNSLPKTSEQLANALYVAFIIVMSIILLNMLIGVVTRHYDDALVESRARWRREQAGIIVDMIAIERGLSGIKKVIKNYCLISICTSSDGRKDDNMPLVWMHEFRKRRNLKMMKTEADSKTATSHLDSSSTENSMTGLIEELHQRDITNGGNKEVTSSMVDADVKLEPLFTDMVHDGHILKAVTFKLPIHLSHAWDSSTHKCVNCAKVVRVGEDSVIYVGITDDEVVALCCYCGRLPSELRVGELEFQGESLQWLSYCPYNSPCARCDKCNQLTPGASDEDVHADKSVIWHGGGQVDLCNMCAIEYFKSKSLSVFH